MFPDENKNQKENDDTEDSVLLCFLYSIVSSSLVYELKRYWGQKTKTAVWLLVCWFVCLPSNKTIKSRKSAHHLPSFLTCGDG